MKETTLLAIVVALLIGSAASHVIQTGVTHLVVALGANVTTSKH